MSEHAQWSNLKSGVLATITAAVNVHHFGSVSTASLPTNSSNSERLRSEPGDKLLQPSRSRLIRAEQRRHRDVSVAKRCARTVEASDIRRHAYPKEERADSSRPQEKVDEEDLTHSLL